MLLRRHHHDQGQHARQRRLRSCIHGAYHFFRAQPDHALDAVKPVKGFEAEFAFRGAQALQFLQGVLQ